MGLMVGPITQQLLAKVDQGGHEVDEVSRLPILSDQVCPIIQRLLARVDNEVIR